jgi:hypothetical protein
MTTSLIFVSCKKDTTKVVTTKILEKETRKPKGFLFTWDEWGHNEEGTLGAPASCPGGGLCNFRLKKIKLGAIRNIKESPLESDGANYFIIALIDNTYPMGEINNFRITKTITQIDEFGDSYTMNVGVYPFDSNLQGFKIPVIIN